MKTSQIEELLYQALETEMGGVLVYRAAVACAVNDDLKEEWEKYGKQTRQHVDIVLSVFEALGLDPEKQTAGRRIVHEKGKSLVAAMEKALSSAGGDAAQLVAAECVVDAETKDHQNWELIGEVAKKASGKVKSALQEAYDQVEDEEDEHLYHTMGWARELWLDSLGLAAKLPPPEEERDVKSAKEEAEVKEERKGKDAKDSGNEQGKGKKGGRAPGRPEESKRPSARTR